MGAKFLSGRDFSAADSDASPEVAIINQTLARRYWPNKNPIGDHLTLLANIYDTQSKTRSQSLEIVGVVGDIKTGEDVWQDHADLYVPDSQLPLASMSACASFRAI